MKFPFLIIGFVWYFKILALTRIETVPFETTDNSTIWYFKILALTRIETPSQRLTGRSSILYFKILALTRIETELLQNETIGASCILKYLR